jgi:hypothetical protein
LMIACAVYIGVLLIVRPFSTEELARLSPLLPTRVRALVTR